MNEDEKSASNSLKAISVSSVIILIANALLAWYLFRQDNIHVIKTCYSHASFTIIISLFFGFS